MYALSRVQIDLPLSRICLTKAKMNPSSTQSRWLDERGNRPVRIANCSGANGDPGYQMYRQATQGSIDFITGDYLAEINLAENAERMASGQHEGWQQTAWDGISQSIDVLNEKKIKVIINGGALNPVGLVSVLGHEMQHGKANFYKRLKKRKP